MRLVLSSGLQLDGTESLDYGQFLAATMERRDYVREDRIQRAFDFFLSSSDETTMSHSTLVSILGSEEQAREILADYDVDGDHQISFEEFRAMIRENDRLGAERGSTWLDRLSSRMSVQHLEAGRTSLRISARISI